MVESEGNGFLLTKKIKVKKAPGGKGIVTLSQLSSKLQLRVATLDSVYQVDKELDELGSEIKDFTVEKFLSFLSGSKDASAIQQMISVKDDKLSIKVSSLDKSGIARKLWTGALEKVEDLSVFEVTETLVDYINQDQDKGSDTDDQIALLKESKQAWEDTAGELEGRWEREKSLLFDNFLTMYKTKQQKLKDLQETVDSLTSKLEEAKKAAEEVAASNSRRAARNNLLDSVPVDGVALDADQVATLAEGKKLVAQPPSRKAVRKKPAPKRPVRKRKAPTRKKTSPHESADEDEAETSPVAKRRATVDDSKKAATATAASSEMEDVEFSRDKKEKPTPAKMPENAAPPTKSKPQKARRNEYSSTDESDAEPAKPVVSRPKRSTVRQSGNHNPYSSSEDESSKPKQSGSGEDDLANVEAALSGVRSEIFAALSSDED